MTLNLLRIKNNLISSILKYKNIFDQQAVFIPLNNIRIFYLTKEQIMPKHPLQTNVLDILKAANDQICRSNPRTVIEDHFGNDLAGTVFMLIKR